MARAIDGDLLVDYIRKIDMPFETKTTVICTVNTMPTIDTVKQEWISVKDRLPEKGKSVLVYWDDGFDIGEYVGGEVGYDIYWMPLPEPPERDDE